MQSLFYEMLKLPWCFFKYRDRQSIIADILKAVAKSTKGRRKTHIMRAAHLNSLQAGRYLELCYRNGYIIIDGYRYRLSEKGLRFLENVDSEVVKMAWRRQSKKTVNHFQSLGFTDLFQLFAVHLSNFARACRIFRRLIQPVVARETGETNC